MQWSSTVRAGAIMLAFAIRPVTALADHWVTINSDVDVAVLEIDVDTIQSRHGYLSAWLRASYASSQPDGRGSMYRSTLNLDLYDCDAGRNAVLQVMEYDDVRGTGKVVATQNYSPQTAQWSYAPPGTAAVNALKLVCARRHVHH